jgi:hypothetical protein
MTTGTKIAIGVGVVGAGAAFVIWQGPIYAWWKNHFHASGVGRVPPRGAAVDAITGTVSISERDPFAEPQLATLPILPDLQIPSPLPMGTFPEPPAGIGVIIAAGATLRGSPPAPLPPPPPPVPLATSVGTLYVPPTITQSQAYAKVNDLAAIYASTERPEDDTSMPVVSAPLAVARSGRGHF